MLFCSQAFFVFFTLVFLTYWAIPWQRARVWLLLAASFCFYASWSAWLALLVSSTTAMDYLIARGMDATAGPRRRKLLLLLSLTVNLGLLCYFKYANFFLESLEEALRAAGASASFPTLSVILPFGISFYTFEAISYTVDVYQRRIRAERNLANFMLFILFFPHLVAGPIVRGRDFLPQVQRRKRWSWLRAELGAKLFLLGLVKKLVIADRMAMFADPIFQDPAAYKTGALWIAVFAYALQVYGDFSGYSDMALGTAHLLGYRLARNFDLPYLAPNITDFWRRWHISLSSWLRDYLFIPLGGGQGGTWRTARNLMITMTLCGLWHGAKWTFVVFGAVQGALLIGHRSFRRWCRQRPRLDRLLASVPGTALRVALTFLVFSTSLVIFRCGTLGEAWVMLGRLLVPRGGLGEPLAASGFALTVAVVALGHALAWRGLGAKLLKRLPAPVQGFGYAATLALALVLAPGAGRAFIYFQF